MQNYLIFLAGDGDVTLSAFCKDQKEAEEYGYKWIADHEYMGDIYFIEEMTPPNEEEL